MKDIKKITLTTNSTLREALKAIDDGSIKFSIVVDENNRLIGTLTDGDTRRGLLNGLTLEDKIESIYFKTPTVVSVNESKKRIIDICAKTMLYRIPIVDDDGRVIQIALLDDLVKTTLFPNKVILMAGGLGNRLRPLTDDTPKPILHVGGKPILQTIIERYAEYGFENITICVNYKSNMIQDYFGDGSKFGVNIDYIVEDKRMGTAGGLSLIKDLPQEPFFVMNGDLLTNLNFQSLLDFHVKNSSSATMCVKEYDLQVPYGVVNIDKNRVKSIEEKPTHKFTVSAGIYVFEPEVISLIPKNKLYDIPTLFQKLIEKKMNVTSFPLEEYWLDIGRIDEYERANREYADYF